MGGFLVFVFLEPTTQRRLAAWAGAVQFGGRYKDRTCDPYHVKVVLYR